MTVAAMTDVNDGDRFLERATALGVANPTLGAYAMRRHPVDDPDAVEAWALVTTAPFSSAWAAYPFWRHRWGIETPASVNSKKAGISNTRWGLAPTR